MFVRAQRTNLLIRQNGDVWTRDLQEVTPEQNALGELIVSDGFETYRVKDLVIAHHGEPPGQLRPPEEDEKTICIDEDELNVDIKNLKIVKKEKQTTTYEDLSEEEVERIAGHIADGDKYQDIIDHYAEKGITLYKPQLTKIKKKFLTE